MSVLLVLLLPPGVLFAQKLVQDTLIVSFASTDLAKPVAHFVIDSVIDRRHEDARVLGRYEKKKFLFIPVDLLVCTTKPLNHEILGVLQQSNRKSIDSLQFQIIIDEFMLSRKTNSLLYPRYILNAAISLFNESASSDSEYIGQLLYELKIRKPIFGNNMKEKYESTLRRWQQEFVENLYTIQENSDFHSLHLDNFRTQPYNGRPTNMLFGFDGILSSKSQMLDTEIYFSHREARKRFFRSGGYNIRYRDADDFEAIEFGLSNDYLFHRFSSNLLFRWKSQIMLGVNRWQDIQTTEHKLYDAVILDYSMSQSLVFNPIDKRSILVGIGLLENVFYVYSKGFQFQVGPLLHLGFKL
jgi:hypothetical protein